MDVTFFVKGLVIGFSLALPVGPIALLLIRRTLARGSLAGLFSGLGAATADMVYGFVAGFGVSVVSNFLIENEMIIRFVSGILLGYLGVRIFFSVPQERTNLAEQSSLLKYSVSTFVLTLTNPITLLAFAAVFAAAGVGGASHLAVCTMVLGVFCGSGAWWLILTGIVSIFHGTLSLGGLRMVNRISGTLIALAGVLVLLSVTGCLNLLLS
jgi:threonine/homoserine/homoserine lactone efflux protein